MQETYTSDFPGMKHRENIRTGYIMTSTAARSDNQLSGFHKLRQVCVLHFSFFFGLSPILVCSFVFQAEGGGIILNSVALSNMQLFSAA